MQAKESFPAENLFYWDAELKTGTWYCRPDFPGVENIHEVVPFSLHPTEVALRDHQLWYFPAAKLLAYFGESNLLLLEPA